MIYGTDFELTGNISAKLVEHNKNAKKSTGGPKLYFLKIEDYKNMGNIKT